MCDHIHPKPPQKGAFFVTSIFKNFHKETDVK